MRSRAALAAALVVSAILSVFLAETWSARRRGGFVVRAENDLDRQISAPRIEAETAALADRPHLAGTPANLVVARRIVQRLEAAGLTVWSTPFEAGLWEPVDIRLSLAGGGPAKGWDLTEGDPAGGPAFLAWSPDADLGASVVYANFGAAADYEALEKAGVSLKGKLALVRAQGVCRGTKARIAAARGLAGLLLYPEPRDQGFAKPPFPEGPNTPPNAIERGSVLAYFLYPGDPAGARRAGVETLPPVPAIGVSQEIARDLLSRMTGDAAPEAWTGWLKTPYILARSGPSVRLVVRGRVEAKTLQNVFAVLPGENDGALPLLVGSHYDAWVTGAVDPSSGTAAVLEVAEALARLRTTWWRPQRAVLFAFWDGEEAGLFGSTRWVEQAVRESYGGLAAYVNVDSAVRAGDFVGNVMPGLRGPLDEVLARVVDPATGRPVAETKGTYRLPGFSSDAGPFLGFTGTPVAEIGFGRSYPVYHTRFDSIEWVRRFGDPGFTRAALFARILALYVGRLASDSVMPYRFGEISAHTREALKAMESEKPATAAWLPAPLRAIRSDMDLFEAASGRWDETLSRLRTVEGPRARKANALVEEAMASFRLPAAKGTPPPFGRANLLVTPSVSEGCPGEAHGLLAEAFRVRDAAAIERESARLSRAYSQAREFLVAAEWVLRGKGEPAAKRR